MGAEIGQRLKRLRHPDPVLNGLARELADSVAEVLEVQKEILSMGKSEAERKSAVMEEFDTVLDFICTLSKTGKISTTRRAVGAFSSSSRFAASSSSSNASEEKQQVEAV